MKNLKDFFVENMEAEDSEILSNGHKHRLFERVDARNGVVDANEDSFVGFHFICI